MHTDFRSWGLKSEAGYCEVSFAEQPPSKQWAAIKFRGHRLAEVWFKPGGEPHALSFRIPQQSFQIPGLIPRLTPENLLKAVGIAVDDVESWQRGDVSHSGTDGVNPTLRNPLARPPEDLTHLEIHVRLKSPQADSANESGERETASARWQDLEGRWKAILGLEATMDTVRISMESVRNEMEASFRRALTAEEKQHALAADMAQWNKAKSRVHYALPKAREFIHRAIWALGTPERKKLDEFFKNRTQQQTTDTEMEQVQQELEHLHKDRQVLSAQGASVYQECKNISADVQAALKRVQTNSASRASKKKIAAGIKGKS